MNPFSAQDHTVWVGVGLALHILESLRQGTDQEPQSRDWDVLDPGRGAWGEVEGFLLWDLMSC